MCLLLFLLCLLVALSHVRPPPRSFLAGKSAKAVLRSTAAYFPSLTCVNLHHTDGWCDPVQVIEVIHHSLLNSRQPPAAVCCASAVDQVFPCPAVALSTSLRPHLTLLHRLRLTVC